MAVVQQSLQAAVQPVSPREHFGIEIREHSTVRDIFEYAERRHATLTLPRVLEAYDHLCTGDDATRIRIYRVLLQWARSPATSWREFLYGPLPSQEAGHQRGHSAPAPVVRLVERFDIETFSDFSAK